MVPNLTWDVLIYHDDGYEPDAGWIAQIFIHRGQTLIYENGYYMSPSICDGLAEDMIRVIDKALEQHDLEGTYAIQRPD